MNQDTNLFVQAFWVKVREVIRPEIDTTIDDLRTAGHDAHVSTQEFSEVPDTLPGHTGPSITLSLVPADAADGAQHPFLEFRGDVVREAVEVLASDGRTQSYEMAALGDTAAKTEIEEWLTRLALKASV
jgi:hypothetical protein